MKLSEEGRERIRAASPIDAVIREYGITLRRVGQGLQGLCCFHRDKTPSLSVQVKEGRFHCFGCGEGGDVFRFVQLRAEVGFLDAARRLCERGGLRFEEQCEVRGEVRVARPASASSVAVSRAPRMTKTSSAPSSRRSPARSSTRPAVLEEEAGAQAIAASARRAELLGRVVEHYHRSFCENSLAQAYARKRGLADPDLLRALKVGYADGSLLATLPKRGELLEQMTTLGVVTSQGRELLGGCLVVPLPDPVSGAWVNLYGRGIRSKRHCYLPGPLRGIWNFQAARLSEEVVLTESVLDALSFHLAGVRTAIPLFGTQGFTAEHADLLKREGVKRVVLSLDADESGRRATEVLRGELGRLGLSVRVARLPAGIKDANELLVTHNGNATAAFRQLVAEAEPRADEDATDAACEAPGAPSAPLGEAQAEADDSPSSAPAAAPSPLPAPLAAPSMSSTPAPLPQHTPEPPPLMTSAPAVPAFPSRPPSSVPERTTGREGEMLTLRRGALVYHAKPYPVLLGRLRVTVKVWRGEQASRFHADTIDLYASRARSEFARRVAKLLSADAEQVEADLLAILVEAERLAAVEETGTDAKNAVAAMSAAERAEALAFLRRADLLSQLVADVDALGYVGETRNVVLLYLVATSRKHPDPLSAVILSQSGAGKSGITVVIERLMPPEDVLLFTRLTPQSLFYASSDLLDRKLVIIEERHGSSEADYSLRVLQSRKKLVAAAPIKDPATGNMKTKVFEVEASAAFIEATTASQMNHENATRCFELVMDESVEQTRRIHERQRLNRTEAGLALKAQAEAIHRRHWNAQRLLEPLPVLIPYADRLTFPVSWMRTRRDHERFLNLIEVSAFLHQHQRERRGGAVVATVADYAAAYELASGVLAETLTDLKKPLHDAHERIRGLCEAGSGSVSRREIREALGEPDSTVRRWLGELVELEYLEVEGGKSAQGKSARYRLSGNEPKRPGQLAGLLSPDELAATAAR